MKNIKIFLIIVLFGILTWLILNIINMFKCDNSTVKTNIIKKTPQPSTTPQPTTTERVLISSPIPKPSTTPTLLQNTSCVYLCPWKTGVA